MDELFYKVHLIVIYVKNNREIVINQQTKERTKK